MAYITPDSDVYLLKGVPLSKDYENTILFSTAVLQSTYFLSKCPSTLTHYFADTSFIRQQPGSLRLEIPAETAMQCNYMMYKNTAYGNKWFYAFIDGVDYVNDKTTSIRFTLDVIQTWHFDYTLEDVFIERNHLKTDDLGDSLTPEPVRFGDYVDNYKIALLDGTCYVVVGTIDISDPTMVSIPGLSIPVSIPLLGGLTIDKATEGHMYQGIYSGLTLTIFKPYSLDASTDPLENFYTYDVDGFLAYYISKGQSDAINCIYMVPAEVLGLSNGALIDPAQGGTQLGSVVNYINTNSYNQLPGLVLSGTGKSTINGYAPKNNKLFSYPYNKLTINNGSGNELNLRYEFFNDPTTPTGQITINAQQPVSVCFMPYNYAGIGPMPTVPQVDVANQDYQIMLGNYPMCSWNVDSYSAWSAQNSINMGNSLIGAGYSAAKGYMGGAFAGNGAANVVGAAAGGISSLISMLMSGYQASRAADTLHGSNTSGNGAIAQYRQNFFAKRMSVNAADAKIIDDYFTMFGYTVNSLYHKNVNDDPRDHRPHWTFIKTVGSDISGNMPASDAAEINRIYDKGIRWWKVASEMNNYSLDNSPVTPTPPTPTPSP